MNSQNNLLAISEIKISYQPKFKAFERPLIRSSKDSFRVMKPNWNLSTIAIQEEFKILLLNTNNKVLGIYHLATGGMDAVSVDTKLIFATALKASASAIMLFHNHPSGNLKPSDVDIAITNRIISAGKLLDIRVLDHLILTPQGTYFSFADEGLM